MFVDQFIFMGNYMRKSLIFILMTFFVISIYPTSVDAYSKKGFRMGTRMIKDANPKRGKKLYMALCRKCHGKYLKATKAMQRKNKRKMYLYEGRFKYDPFRAIKFGQGKMPAFKKRLEDEDIDDILAFMRVMIIKWNSTKLKHK